MADALGRAQTVASLPLPGRLREKHTSGPYRVQQEDPAPIYLMLCWTNNSVSLGCIPIQVYGVTPLSGMEPDLAFWSLLHSHEPSDRVKDVVDVHVMFLDLAFQFFQFLGKLLIC